MMNTHLLTLLLVCSLLVHFVPLAAAADSPADRKSPQNTTTRKNADQSSDQNANTTSSDRSVQSERPSFTLDEIIITATRTKRSVFDVPASVEVIDRTRLDEAMYRTTPELFRDIPAVMVQKTSHGQGSPYIRGFTSQRNVFLIDGIRLNNSAFREGPNQYWNTVDPFTIQRIEVIKGPSSVLYGSDAIGGTINAITRSPYTYGDGWQSGGLASYRISSAERSHIGRGEISVTHNDQMGFLAGATLKQFGDLQSGAGRQPNTGYDEYDVDFKFEHQLGEHAKLIMAHQRVRQNNVPRTHRTIFAKSFAGTTIGSDLRRDLDQERELTYLQIHGEEMNGIAQSVHAGLSWQVQSETRDRIKGSGARQQQGFEVGTLGLFAHAESDTSIGTLTYGVEYYHDNVNSFASDNPIQGPVADDATYDMLGLFIQDEIELSSDMDLILGGRFNYARADANNVSDPIGGGRISLTDDWTSFVGSARLVYHLLPDRVNLYGGISQGFRTPNFSDLTRFDTARTNEIETPAPGLDPEQFIQYEIGVKANYEKLSAQAAYFYTDISDMIVRTPTGVMIGTDFEVTKVNAGDGFIQGIEFGAAWQPADQWTIFGNFAWIEGEVDTFPTSAPIKASEYLDRLMPITGQVGVRWDHPEDHLWAEAVVVMADRADKLSTRDKADTGRIHPGGTPGYGILHLRGGWEIDDNLDLTLALENITDKNYRIHGSGQNESGINLIFSLRWTF